VSLCSIIGPVGTFTMSLVGHPKIILYTKFEHFEIIHTNRQTDRERDRQTNLNVLPTLTDSGWHG